MPDLMLVLAGTQDVFPINARANNALGQAVRIFGLSNGKHFQTEVNRCSLTLSALDIQSATIVFQYPVDDGQSQTGTAVLGGIKRIENGINILRRNSLTIVRENDLYLPVFLNRPYGR